LCVDIDFDWMKESPTVHTASAYECRIQKTQQSIWVERESRTFLLAVQSRVIICQLGLCT
jgi:hypothetical protein